MTAAPVPQIPLAHLPDCALAQVDFLDSSWFRHHRHSRAFPSPDHVRSLAIPARSRHLVKFEELDLIVKFGPHISTAEAVNLWVVRKAFHNHVPVPEVYGWRVVPGHGGLSEVFIYTQLIRGPTLAQRWESMLDVDKQTVCSHLQDLASRFRMLGQNKSGPAVGRYQSLQPA